MHVSALNTGTDGIESAKTDTNMSVQNFHSAVGRIRCTLYVVLRLPPDLELRNPLTVKPAVIIASLCLPGGNVENNTCIMTRPTHDNECNDTAQ